MTEDRAVRDQLARYGIARRRFVCPSGHSLYVSPPPTTATTRDPSTKVCGDCGEDFMPPPGTPHAQKCDTCLTANHRRYGRAAVAS